MLSTKTLDPAALQYAQTQHLELTCIDFIETSGLPFNTTDLDTTTFDTVAFTSANAVQYFFDNKNATALLANKLVFALQGKTAEALAARNIQIAGTAPSAAELAEVIISGNSVKSVLHICGNLKLTALEDALTFSGITYRYLLVYQTVKQGGKKVNDDFDAILFFSPSGVDSFLIENDLSSDVTCCCIGQTTAGVLKQRTGRNNIILPKEPTPTAMLAAVAAYLKA